ncbi:MAG: hypothetical protein HY748_02990 [Elusimicrobia bacterium]|nr:hypothetical protein [Elusimicrobiota bacterium]
MRALIVAAFGVAVCALPSFVIAGDAVTLATLPQSEIEFCQQVVNNTPGAAMDACKAFRVWMLNGADPSEIPRGSSAAYCRPGTDEKDKRLAAIAKRVNASRKE